MKKMKEIKNVSQDIEEKMEKENLLPSIPPNPGKCGWCGSDEDGIGCGAGEADLTYHWMYLDSGKLFINDWISDSCWELADYAREAIDNDNS